MAFTIIASICVAAENGFREGYFNGSSFAKLSTSLSLYDHIGLSFKSCVGGKLFEQQETNGNLVSII